MFDGAFTVGDPVHDMDIVRLWILIPGYGSQSLNGMDLNRNKCRDIPEFPHLS